MNNYSRQTPKGWIDRLACRKRKYMYELFTTIFPPHYITSVLDVGVTADTHSLSSNYFEQYFPDKYKITVLSDQNAYFLESIYPGLTFRQGDAKALPFADKSMDIVFSSAVIEHLGDEAAQQKMLRECFRVAKKGVFITTPNRWHPMEVHTLLPFIHWLPKKWHRYLLQRCHYDFYAKEDHLNLLDRKTLNLWCRALTKSFNIYSIYTAGFVSNLVLVMHK